MEEPISELPAEVSELLDLGRILGENHAFGVVAGRCTAAQAAGLLRLRVGKAYLQCAQNWMPFATASSKCPGPKWPLYSVVAGV
jgi:hypothetical protein